jgi:hypothetical protein
MIKQRPKEYDYASYVAYGRALEDYCNALEGQPEQSVTEDHSLLAQMLYEQTPTYQMGLNDRVMWRDATPEARRKWIDKAAYGIGKNT